MYQDFLHIYNNNIPTTIISKDKKIRAFLFRNGILNKWFIYLILKYTYYINSKH